MAVSLSRAALLLVVVTGAAAVAAASSPSAPTGPSSATEDAETKPSILTPIAHTPLGSFEGADGPVADDAMDDEEAAPVGSPIGTTMTEPEPEQAPPGPPGDSSGTAASVRGPAAAAVAAAAVAAAAGAIFAF